MTEPTVIEQLKWSKDDYSNIDTPFAGDHWGREQFAKHLTGYVGRMKVGATIAIDAEWGAGKTWFVQHWKQHLIKEGHTVAYIDAFANDYVDDPFLLIATEIANQVGKKNPSAAAKFKQSLITTYHATLPSMPKLIFSATMAIMGAGLFAPLLAEAFSNAKEATGEFGENLAEEINEKMKEQLEEKVKNYEADKQTLENFKNQLTEAASTLDKPLVFIIDELDRCKPEFSIRLIERIKHFFEIPNIVFVLAIHKKQLCESIDSYYGFKSENQYLDKFIDFSFKLSTEKNFKEKSENQIVALLRNLGLDEPQYNNGVSLFKACSFLCSLYKPTPRQLKAILNKFSLLYTIDNAAYRSDLMLICLFLKETGKDSKIKKLEFIDDIVKDIVGWSEDYLRDDDLKANNLSITIRRVLSGGKYGLSTNITQLLTAFSSITSYENDTRRDEAQENACLSFMPNISEGDYKELGQAWLDYIQRGTL